MVFQNRCLSPLVWSISTAGGVVTSANRFFRIDTDIDAVSIGAAEAGACFADWAHLIVAEPSVEHLVGTATGALAFTELT